MKCLIATYLQEGEVASQRLKKYDPRSIELRQACTSGSGTGRQAATSKPGADGDSSRRYHLCHRIRGVPRSVSDRNTRYQNSPRPWGGAQDHHRSLVEACSIPDHSLVFLIESCACAIRHRKATQPPLLAQGEKSSPLFRQTQDKKATDALTLFRPESTVCGGGVHRDTAGTWVHHQHVQERGLI